MRTLKLSKYVREEMGWRVDSYLRDWVVDVLRRHMEGGFIDKEKHDELREEYFKQLEIDVEKYMNFLDRRLEDVLCEVFVEKHTYVEKGLLSCTKLKRENDTNNLIND